MSECSAFPDSKERRPGFAEEVETCGIALHGLLFLSKVLANRLKNCINLIIHKDWSYCTRQVHHGQPVPDKGPIGRL